MRFVLAFVMVALTTPVFAGSSDKVALSAVSERAVEQSKLTLPGSKPFHLKASIIETTNPKSEYRADIEEFWVSPTKWRRTIEAPGFSQTLVMNEEAVLEKDTGDYFPLWLNHLMTAMIDPLPMLDALKRSEIQISKPHGSDEERTCANLQAKVDRWVICFAGGRGLLSSVFTKGYSVQYEDYKTFGEKRVARHLIIDPEPGTKIEARVTELNDLGPPDEQLFRVQHQTPQAERIKSVRVEEDTFRKLSLGNTDIDWPPTGGGPANGGCAVYVSADRKGAVREVWPAGCDSTGLQNPLRDAVKKWRLKPGTLNGVPVQVEALLGFEFHAKADNANPLPQLSDAEARKLATSIVEPIFPPASAARGAEFIVQISVDETGKLTGVQNTHHVKDPIFLAAYAALAKWRFKPYLKDGKPQYFHSDIIFRSH